tara:strand:+ start:153 stop:275 length:123 start_codon:yes stop_codon:yes gene_type:complete
VEAADLAAPMMGLVNMNLWGRFGFDIVLEDRTASSSGNLL